jgi:hypothetical protein
VRVAPRSRRSQISVARMLRLLVKAILVDADVKNYLRDEDPTTGQVMSFPVPMEFGLINYRAAISQALELGYRGAFLCEYYGSDSITVIGKNRAYIREILATLTTERSTQEKEQPSPLQTLQPRYPIPHCLIRARLLSQEPMIRQGFGRGKYTH